MAVRLELRALAVAEAAEAGLREFFGIPVLAILAISLLPVLVAPVTPVPLVAHKAAGLALLLALAAAVPVSAMRLLDRLAATPAVVRVGTPVGEVGLQGLGVAAAAAAPHLTPALFHNTMLVPVGEVDAAVLLPPLIPAIPVTRQTLRPLTRSQLLPVRPILSPLVLRVDKLLYRGTHSNV
jgi:hypothetical protein